MASSPVDRAERLSEPDHPPDRAEPLTDAREMTIGIVLFPQVEELDFVGPFEVFSALRELGAPVRVLLLAEQSGAVTCANGMRVLPDLRFDEAPELDVLLVPGGIGTRAEAKNPAMLAFIKRAGANCTWLTSVCTGALLLYESGFARGRRVTTHWAFVETLRARGDIEVLDGPRYVRDGRLVSAAGVSAGIDMALWLVGQLHTPELARKVQRFIQYDPAPPWGADRGACAPRPVF